MASLLPVLRPARPPVELLDRQGRGPAVRPARGGPVRRPRDGLSRSRPTPPGGPTPTSSGPTARSRRNTLVDIWRCHELWSLLGELARRARCHPRGRRVARGTGLPDGHPGGRGSASTSPCYLCDTWEGVVKTGAIDTYYRDGKHDDASKADRPGRSSTGWASTDVECLQGIFPDDTGDRSPTTRFRLCHIDVDVYQSASDVLDWVWPRLSPTGRRRVRRLRLPRLPRDHPVRRRAAHARRPPRPPQPQRPWPHRQALTSAGRPRRVVRPAPRAPARSTASASG